MKSRQVFFCGLSFVFTIMIMSGNIPASFSESDIRTVTIFVEPPQNNGIPLDDDSQKEDDTKNPQQHKDIILIFRNNTNHEIAKILLNTEFPVSAEEITKEMKKSRSTISVNLKKLEKMQLIGRKILNKNKKLTSDIGFYILDKEMVRMIFSKYNFDIKK